MKRIISICLLLAVLCLPLSAALTTITDTVYTPAGTTFTGRAVVTLQNCQPCINSAGTTLTPYRGTVTITSGVLSTALEANDAITPAGTSYSVRLYGAGIQWTEIWIVPTSATAVTLAGVRSVSIPSATSAYSLISGLTAGDLLYGAATGYLSRLPKGTNGQYLTLSAGFPAWGAAPGGATVSTDLSDSSGLVRGAASLTTTGAIVKVSSSGHLGEATAGTDYGLAYVPVTLSTSSPVTVSGNVAFYFNNSTGAMTYNLPTITSGTVGAQYCFRNAVTKTGAITLKAPSSTYIDVSGTNGTAAGTLVSSGAAGDSACVVAVSTTQYAAYVGGRDMGQQLSRRQFVRTASGLLVPAAMYGQILSPIIYGTQSGIPRDGLVADYDLTGGADVQSIANGVSGGPALQRGSTSGADTNDPTPGVTGWGFDGTDDYGKLANTFAFTTGQERTYVAVFQMPHTLPASYTMFTGGASPGGDNHFLAVDSSGAVQGRIYYGVGGVDFVSPTSSAKSVDSWHIAILVARSQTADLVVDGVTASLTYPSGAPIAGSITYVGCWTGSPLNYPYSGRIARVLAYSRGLSTSDLTRLQTVLKSWGAGKGITLP